MSPAKTLKILALAVCASLWACTDDGSSSGVPSQACLDIVTIDTTGPSGTIFTIQTGEDTPIVEYQTKISFSPDSVINPELRIIIAYNRIDGLPYTSGPIDLYGYRFLDNTMQPVLIDSVSDWQSQPVDVKSMTRTGQFLNMQLQLSTQAVAKAKKLELMADPATILDKRPVLRLIYEAEAPGENYFTGWASFNLKLFKELDYYDGVTVLCQLPDRVSSTEIDF